MSQQGVVLVPKQGSGNFREEVVQPVLLGGEIKKKEYKVILGFPEIFSGVLYIPGTPSLLH